MGNLQKKKNELSCNEHWIPEVNFGERIMLVQTAANLRRQTLAS